MPTSVRLRNNIERRRDVSACETDRTKAFYFREMILENFDDIEDRHRRSPPAW
jgi:RHH-type rel operon transcriptional repressor/antitoxin RelB